MFFESITREQIQQYNNDWQTIIQPRSDHETLNRWRFSFCTVHTSWKQSCEQYLALQNTYECTDYQSIAKILRNTGGGMWDIKATGISKLHDHWINQEPMLYNKTCKGWQKYRNELVSILPKLGLAKTSFALEMLHPINAQIICIDTHMWQAFGWTNPNDTPSTAQYHYYENYWVDQANEYDVPPVTSRNLFWDQIQNQSSSLYWADYLDN